MSHEEEAVWNGGKNELEFVHSFLDVDAVERKKERSCGRTVIELIYQDGDLTEIKTNPSYIRSSRHRRN